MSAYPAWFAEVPDAVADQAAYATACTGSVDANVVHRAARRHHWHQSSSAVQAWAGAAYADATKNCETQRWTALTPLAGVSERSFEFVTHRPVRWLPDPVLKSQCLTARADPDVLRKVAIQVHTSATAASTGRPKALWLGSAPQGDAVATFDSDHMHDIVSAFGLWHFGELPADEFGAILRIVYRLEPSVPLFKPDWRHGYPGFYFACAPTVPGSGLARELQTGQLRCKEWIARATDIDPHRAIVSASCVLPTTAHNHHELPATYWNAVAQEIQHASKSAP